MSIVATARRDSPIVGECACTVATTDNLLETLASIKHVPGRLIRRCQERTPFFENDVESGQCVATPLLVRFEGIGPVSI